MTLRICTSFILAITLVSGCGGSGSEAPTEPPEGWQAEEGRWWKQGTDTTQAFRNLESLSSMGVTSEDKVYAASGADVSASQLTAAVREQLLPLYRNQPRVVDSLFEARVRPDIRKHLEEEGPGTNLTETVKELRDEGYQTIRDAFQEPRSATTLGEDVPVTYPDSLREQGVGGRVETQVYLDEEGNPQAIQLMEGTGHPVIDQGAMRTAALSRWEPAHVLQDGEWQGVSSWVRYSLNF